MSILRTILRLYVDKKKIATFGIPAFIIGLMLGALLFYYGGIPSLTFLSHRTLHLLNRFQTGIWAEVFSQQHFQK